ncbi:hypothetical protein R3I93_020186 [Phoxinus phoxinus]|uniref:Uncharacterized protein n=1 Tax=Phoxinus phoxinus TaxID=58324 RepID=A0AAN9CB86_9TELE
MGEKLLLFLILITFTLKSHGF